MTAMRPEDVDDLFGLDPLPAASEAEIAAAAAAAQAEEAALAAELAATLESGGVAGDAPDSRTNQRVDVAWPARMHLPDGRVIELKVRNVSVCGVGLTSDEPIPDYTVVHFEMGVPQPDDGNTVARVKGTIRTTYTMVHGSQILIGGSWQAPPAGLDLVQQWIQRLRR
jgi:hypothetical protein